MFGLLNTKKVQNYTRDLIVNELRQKLDTELDIKRLYFRPFNTISVDSLYVLNKNSEEILLIDNVSASVDLFDLLKKKIVISSARISDLDVHLSKASADSTLNIQFIIDAFKSKDNKQKSPIEFKINAISIANGSVHYNILDRETKEKGFDPNHISIRDWNAKLALKSLKNDSLNIQIKKFDFKEKSGFEVTDLVARLTTKDNKVWVKGFELILPKSKIEFGKLELELAEKRTDSLKIYQDDVKLDFILKESYISPNDIVAFVPQLEGFEDRVLVGAKISGTEHSLQLNNLTLAFGKTLKLKANAEIIDWQEGKDTYLLASIDELTTSGNDVENLANGLSSKPVSIPKGVVNQQKISFQGDVSGYLDQLKAFGALDTDDGIVRTDMLFGFNKKEKVFSHAKGKIYTTHFNLGHFLANDNLGDISFSLALDFNKPLYKDFKGEVKGTVKDFDFKGYRYEDISLDVLYAQKKVDGNLLIDDENGFLKLDGLLDLTDQKYPVLNLTAKVENVQLDKLNLAQKMEGSYLSLNVNADFIGSTVDNVQGYISIDSLEFYKQREEFKLNKFLVEASGLFENKDRKIEITSDLLNGYVMGESKFMTLPKNFQKTIALYLPALFLDDKQKSKKVEKDNNDIKFHFDIANTEELSGLLNLPVTIYKPTVIDGFYNSNTDKLKVEVDAPLLKAGGMKIHSAHVLVNNKGEAIQATVRADIEGKNNVLSNVVLDSSAKDDGVRSTISLENNSERKAKGEFALFTKFENLGRKKGLKIEVGINESKLLLNNQNWKMEESLVTLSPDLIEVDNFSFHTVDKKQELRIDGKYSKRNPSHILKTELSKIDLSYVFETLAIDALKFGGYASGDVYLSSVEEKPYANTQLDVEDFQFNYTPLGRLSLFSELDEKTNQVILDGTVTSKENKKTKVDGSIDPVNQRLSIHFDADSIDIGFLKTYAESIFDKVSGRGTGKVHLYGDFSNVTVEGVADIIDGNIGIKFLNTDYTFSDRVYMREGFIYFNDITFKDQYNNIAVGSGKVVHDYFQNIMYHIELNADNFLVYNVPESQNPLFFGKVYGSGKGILGGDENDINIEINMKTQPNTLVRMNLMGDEIDEYSFVTYKQPEKAVETPEKSDFLVPIKASTGANINMNFYIDATPDATIEMVMDPVGGDILRGSGEGALQFVWSSKLAPQLFGTFNVNRGSYNFTFQRIMERKFSIKEGSTIQFRGDPFEATLDVNAIYKLTASLSDLDRTLVEQSGQASLPVHCILNLTGPLKKPAVGLDIAFPTANADVARQIKSYMDTEDMINRQVAYLLLLSKFHTPDMGNVDHPSSDFAVIASATLSSQLSKIISQVDSRWQLGTHIRMSDAEFTSTEVELLLSSQLLNDRLIINGNFGYRDDPYVNKDAVITDVDIEYLLNTSGTWRVKAYNHYNEKFYYLQDKGLQTQGLGLMYRKDFDKLYELFPFRSRRKMKKTGTSIHHVFPDSLKNDDDLSSFIRIREK